MSSQTRESDLLSPLIRGLLARRWLSARSTIVQELPWCGRRVDLAVLTCKRKTIALELKLNVTRRALYQSSYNQLAFDACYVVTSVPPTRNSIRVAESAGIGILVVRRNRVVVALSAPVHDIERRTKNKLVSAIREASDVRKVFCALP